jgi:hypothetical protein
MEYIVKKDGDITVILRQIEIKNAAKWSKGASNDAKSKMNNEIDAGL